jgi:peroxiredoxin
MLQGQIQRQFPFPLLADEDKSVIEGVKFMGKEYDGIHRTTLN